jgi:RimJ/RimL family protein N-acetyltransferase
MADLTYRNIRGGDFPELHHIASQWDVVRQLGGWPWPADPKFTKSRCKPFKGNGFVWAVCLNDKLCGSIGVTGGDVGYMFDPAVQGRGIASQALTTAINHAFKTDDHDMLTGSTWYDNRASYRVLQKMGFEHWATRYERAKARGLPTLVHYHRLTRITWDRLRTTPQ